MRGTLPAISAAAMTNSFQTFTENYRGFTIRVDWFYDSDTEAPWEHEDGHGEVSDWKPYYRGESSKAPGERVLHADRGSARFYDWQGAIAKAKSENWGLSEEDTAALAAKLGRQPTKGDIAAEAVRRDFEYLRRWCNDDWFWCGYVVTVEGLPELDDRSLWGIDSDSIKYFTDDEALPAGRAAIDAHLSEVSEVEQFSAEVSAD